MSQYLVLVFSVILFIILVIKLYIVLTQRWCRSQTCLVGKTVIVTGANTGIGYQAALDFAKRGARVILACRDKKRADDARERIIEETGNENVVVKLIDLSSFKSVRAFAKEINENEDRLDILVNNAGLGGTPETRTEDGKLMLMQVNYYSPFLLTLLLIGLLKKTKQSRVVNVASLAARLAFNFDLNKIEKFPGKFIDYAHSKLCNILFTKELAKKLEGTSVTTYSLHPGAIDTELPRYTEGIAKVFLKIIASVFMKTSDVGAQTTIYCSVEKGIEKFNGGHFDDCRRVAPYETARSSKLPKKLWDVTADIVQLKPEENPF